MGSAQQVILGFICLAAAFVFGQYVSTHPDPEQLAEQQQQELAKAHGDSLPLPKTSGKLPAPGAGFGEQPKPVVGHKPPYATYVDIQSSPASGMDRVAPPLPTVVETVAEKRDSDGFIAPLNPDIQIEVPDFSDLAASVRNTPLELKPVPAAVQPNLQRRREPTSLRQPASPPLLPEQPLEQPMVAESAPVANQQQALVEPAILTQQDDWTSSFQASDFEPALKSDPPRPEPNVQPAVEFRPVDRKFAEANPSSQPSFDERASVSVFRAEPELSPLYQRPANAVRSYYSDPLESQVPARDLAAQDWSRREQPVEPVDTSPERQRALVSRTNTSVLESDNEPVFTRKPVIPFGLNAEARSDLARIRDRRDTQIDLHTDSFDWHTTQPGDTLQSISTQYYGKPDFYLDIYLANQKLLRNPADLPAGTQLRIPKY